MGPKAPQYQPPPEDPQTLALKQQAEQDDIAAGEARAQIDSASLMARYGTRLTLAAAGGASGALPSVAAPQPSNILAALQNYRGGGLPAVAAQTSRTIGGGAAA